MSDLTYVVGNVYNNGKMAQKSTNLAYRKLEISKFKLCVLQNRRGHSIIKEVVQFFETGPRYKVTEHNKRRKRPEICYLKHPSPQLSSEIVGTKCIFLLQNRKITFSGFLQFFQISDEVIAKCRMLNWEGDGENL